MRKNILYKLIIGLLIIVMTNCSKYEEGGITANAKSKLTKTTWIKVSDSLNDTLDEVKYPITYTFKEDGSLLMQLFKEDSTYSNTSIWKLKDENKTITIGYQDYVIDKLTDEDFWYSLTLHNVILPGEFNSTGRTMIIVRKFKAQE